MARKEHRRRLIELAEREGMLRPRDLVPYGITREYLLRLLGEGLFERVGRGLYVLANRPVTEHETLAEACKCVPQGIVCLASALRFHEMTTQAPDQVWMAIGARAWKPRLAYPPFRFVRFSGQTLSAGVEEHRVGGVTVRVYDAAKTVADCFKYRNKLGIDVAIEALRDCRRHRKATNDDLWRYAKMCRVANIMRPYMEALS
jgi:predicted transcriptional regulator of viral defense system